MEQTKNSKAKLIRDFFQLSGSDALKQIKDLSEHDRLQLGTAIAQNTGLKQEDCDFQFSAY